LFATSDRDLHVLTDAGSFRPELSARLGARTIAVPPLRERGDDIVTLVQRFLLRFARERGVVAPRLSDPAVELLKRYPWPGNIAEMRNRIQQLVVTTKGGVVGPMDLPASLRAGAGGETDPTRSLAEVEAAHVRTVLASVAGNKTKAAEILGINRKTLREKLGQSGEA
jgi:DNA-binding NtrC family response regulator